MALAGVAVAETLTLDTKAALSYEGATSLAAGNKLVSWSTESDFATLDSWYLEITMVAATVSVYDVMFESKGIRESTSLALLVKNGSITLGEASNNKTPLDAEKSITFAAGDVITMAYYDGKLYLGNTNVNRKNYFEVTPTTGMTTTLVSGTPRVWTNGKTTPVGTATIYSLENVTIPAGEKLDMATLMTTGVAQTMQLVPEPTTATLSLLALAGLAARRRRK